MVKATIFRGTSLMTKKRTEGTKVIQYEPFTWQLLTRLQTWFD